MSVFDVAGEAYDDFMGRYSIRLAGPFADFAGVRARQRVLDVGAGTGALTGELRRRGATVVALEPSAALAASLRTRFADLDVHEGTAEDLEFSDDSFDVAVAQLVVAFMTDAPAAMSELARVARRVAICMWGIEEVEMFAAIGRTASALGAGSTEQGARRYRTPHELVGLLSGAGLTGVEAGTLDVVAPYRDFDDFWHALSGMVGPAGAWLKRLDDGQRAAAREELHRQLGCPHGGFALTARAYGARAVRAA